MANATDWRRLIEVTGDNETLVDMIRPPLQHALSDRGAFYAVRVEEVGRVGEVLVSITGAKGRLPLIFRSEELEKAGQMSQVVRTTVARFDF
jgi:hypothetical protein